MTHLSTDIKLLSSENNRIKYFNVSPRKKLSILSPNSGSSGFITLLNEEYPPWLRRVHFLKA